MSNPENLERFLEEALKKLNRSAEQIVETGGYSQEAEKIRMLEELIKEQLHHENTHSAVSQTR